MNCPKCGASLVAGSGFCSGCGQAVAVAGAGAPAKKSKLVVGIIIAAVVCFMAIPVIGIIAAIAIPNLLSAIQRGKQKRTMGDMKTLASAIESYNTDENHYPVAENMDELCKLLTPDYMMNCIRKDGWWTPQQPREFAYLAWEGTPEGCPKGAPAPDSTAPEPGSPEDPCGPHHYVIASAGKDGKFDHQDLRDYERRDTGSFNDDIVIRDGEFIQSPSGPQRNTPSR
jgi:type II secretory pathway pseudopilin PulG